MNAPLPTIARLAVITTTLGALATTARAQSPQPIVDSPSVAADASLATAGFVAGFLAHEAGHFAANWALGNRPTVEGGLAASFVPFVFVRPHIDCEVEPCHDADGDVFESGRRGKFAIVTAGFHVQHLVSEAVLTGSPELHGQRAPFRKGLLAFGLATSLFYAAASWSGIEDPRGDLANASRLSGLSPHVLAALVAVPAALDVARYVYPHTRWLPWASRAAKGSLVGVTFAW